MAHAQYDHDHRGLLVPFTQARGAALTATSQAGPRPGTVTRTQWTALSVGTSGQISTGETYRVSTSRAGVPGPFSATWQWKKAVGELLRGWDPPTALSAWQFIDRSTTAGKWSKFDAVRLPSGRILVAAVKDGTDVVVWSQSIQDEWSEVTVEATGHETAVSIDVLPSGRVHCWYVRYVNALYSQVRLAYSDDDGATWTVGSDGCLPVPFATPASGVTRLRARYVAGAVVLVMHALYTTDYLVQYASSDEGCTFQRISAFSTSERGGFDVVVADGQVLLATVERDTTLTSSQLVPYLRRLASPYQAYTDVDPVLMQETTDAAEWGTWSGSAFTRTDIAMLRDDDGVLYVYGVDRDATSFNNLIVRRSVDAGETWGSIGAEDIWQSGDASTYLYDLTVVPERGRAVLIHRCGASPGTADDSICAAYLGGFSTHPLPWIAGLNHDSNVSQWSAAWLPIDKPEDIGSTWTRTIVGAPSTVLNADGIAIGQALGEEVYWTATPGAGSDEEGLLVDLQLAEYTSGTGRVYVRISDGTDGYAVEVVWSSGQLELWDRASGVSLGTASVSLTNGVDVRIIVQHPGADWTLDDGAVRALYRLRTKTGASVDGPSPDREWTHLASSTALVSGAYTTKSVQWGCSAGVAVCTIGPVWYGVPLDAQVANDGFPDRGRAWCGASSPAYIGRYGARIHATSGPTQIGDGWVITPTYDYPVTALDPWRAPSPRRVWRSTDTTQQDIVIPLDVGLIAGDVVGIYLQGANFATAALYNDSGAATKIADIDLKISGGLKYTRTRDRIAPAGTGGSDAPHFLAQGVLAGASWQYSVGGTVRRVRTNDAGTWLSSSITGYKPAAVWLDDYDGADASSGSAGILISDRVLIVTDIAVATDALLLRIPAQSTAEGYFELGVMMPGWMRIWGAEYGWGRALDVRHGWDVVEAATGSRSARQARPSRRAGEMAWADGVDVSQLYGAVAPNYVTLGYTSAPPAAVAGADVPGSLLALVRDIGPSVPVVYVPALPQAAAAPTSSSPLRVVDGDRLLYGRIMTETLRVDTVVGNEHASPGEVVRTGTVRIEEEV